MGQMIIVDEDHLHHLNNWAIIGKTLASRIDYAASDIYGADAMWEGPTVANVANEQLTLIIESAKRQHCPWYRRLFNGL